MQLKKFPLEKLLSAFVFVTLVLSILFLVIKIVITPGEVKDYIISERTKSDYVLMLLQCILGVVAMLLPSVFSKRMKVIIPSGIYILYVVFLYCAIYLGEVKSFYYNVPQWDSILHWFSGAMLGALGFSFVTLLNKEERVPVNMSPLFVAIFAFNFALALGVVWEVYEFSFDGLFGLNMQKFALEDGTLLQGRAALMDTMKDLIIDSIGALITSILGYISLKYKKGWIEKIQIRKKKTLS